MYKVHSSLCTQKEFGYSKIKWLVKNYFAATSGKKRGIDSPHFVVYGDQCTEWKLSLKIHNVKGLEYVSVFLKCMEPSPSRIRGNWKLFFPFHKLEVPNEIECDFEQKKMFGMQLCSADRLEDIMQHNTTDTLTIKCQLIVYSKDRKMYDRPKDLGLKSLSQDMRVLYSVDRNHDINLSVSGESVKAHKAVLCSRNDFLKELIEESDSEIDLEDLSSEGVKNVMGYLYSGNLDYVLRTPSYSIVKCIKHLKIKELEVYYKKDAVVLFSEYDVKKHVLEWNISGIDLNKQNCFISPVCKQKELNMAFQFNIYSKGFSETGTEHMSLFIEIVDGSFSQIPYLEFAVIDSNDSIQYLQRKRWPREAVKLEIECFLLKDIFKDLTENGRLRVLCNIMIDLKSGSLITESILHPVFPVETEHHYELLSRQISCLFESGLHSDFTIKCESESFKIHTCIVGARSYVLRSMFQKVGDVKSFFMQRTKYDVLTKMLSYIYSGMFVIQDIEDVFKLYKAAERFSILPLKNACSTFLQRNIDARNITKVLVLADDNKDHKLKACAFRYLSDHSSELLREMSKNTNKLDE